MKIIVVSDTHGIISNDYINIIKKISDAKLLIHVGDYTKDAKDIAHILNMDFINVKGNCDFSDKSTDETLEFDIEGKKIFITHGDDLEVKYTMKFLQGEAKKRKADIVIFGHTHKPYNEIIDEVLYFNPGSPTRPRGNHSKSFGVIDIGDKLILGRLFCV